MSDRREGNRPLANCLDAVFSYRPLADGKQTISKMQLHRAAALRGFYGYCGDLRHGRGDTDRIMYREVTGRTLLCLATILLCVSVARADYEQGLKAWNAGRPAEALIQWRNAAEAEDRRAMLRLGRLYLQGLGAPQDYILAHMWFNLSARRGEAEALRERDALAAKMAPQQIASAQERARAWRPDRKGGSPKSAAVPSSTAPSPPTGPPPHAIHEAQGLIAALGYKPGMADGRWSPRTAKAYAAFLRDVGMPPGNVLTPAGLRAMRASAKLRNVSAPAAPAGRPAANLHRLVAEDDIDGLKGALLGATNVNARDRRGWSALMHAANKGYVPMVASLLGAGANVNLRAPDGATALFVAALHGHSEIVAALMKARADVRIRGPGGKTPADVARRKYGTVTAALKKKENAFVVGLIDGMTGGQVAWEQRLLMEKKQFRDCARCPQMVVVPSGWFMMGAASDEERAKKSEFPQRRVTIPRPFAVGKYEVTFAEWSACVFAGGCNGYRPDDEHFGQGRRPVINVNWEDTKSYVAWLSRKTGEQYRLLSEAEWEYAARAGTEEPFHFGSRISTDQAKYDGNLTYGWGRMGVYRKQTVPVSSFPRNGFGLHDLHANVGEWVEDCWHDGYRGAPPSGDAWVGSGDCGMRILRGGGWNDGPVFLRSANRTPFKAGTRSDYIGFRVARTLPP